MTRRRRISVRWTDKGATLVYHLRSPSGLYAGERLLVLRPGRAEETALPADADSAALSTPPAHRLH